jgi:hypothetical protein
MSAIRPLLCVTFACPAVKLRLDAQSRHQSAKLLATLAKTERKIPFTSRGRMSFRHSIMKTLFVLSIATLFCLSCASADQQNLKPNPKQLTATDLQKLRWIEGSWRGSGDNQPFFYERYRFENETTLAVDTLENEKVTETTLFVLKDGEFGGGSEGSRYVATSLDDNSITFEPAVKATNSFRWQRETKDTWKAFIILPAKADKPARETVHNMERWPKQ